MSASPQDKISMWGEGDYSLFTQGAKDAIDHATPLAVDAISNLDVAKSAAPFQIADYAAADGGTSIDLHRQVIGAVRKRAPDRPICVTYTDLPSNDYCALFRIVQGDNPNFHSYVLDHENVFTSASATSFYKPIFPPESVDFGFSATAMHWLSSMPCLVSEHIHAVGARGEELAQLRTQAAQDWQTILLSRAQELKTGAPLLMVNLAIDDNGQHMGNTGGVHMFNTMNNLWRALVDDGTISETEYRKVVVPQFYRSMDEFCAPLLDHHGPVFQAGLRLESASIEQVACPYQERFKRDGNAAEFARAFVPTTRTWSETAFINSLNQDRSLTERQAITGRLFDDYVNLVEHDPDGHGMAYVHAYLLLVKV